MFKISKEFTFSASHQLEHLVQDDHPCKRLHGHNYTVALVLEGNELDERGFVEDYRNLDRFKVWVDDELDHRHLNTVLGSSLATTAENLARLIFEKWVSAIPQLVAVRVSETPKTWSEYRP